VSTASSAASTNQSDAESTNNNTDHETTLPNDTDEQPPKRTLRRSAKNHSTTQIQPDTSTTIATALAKPTNTAKPKKTSKSQLIDKELETDREPSLVTEEAAATATPVEIQSTKLNDTSLNQPEKSMNESKDERNDTTSSPTKLMIDETQASNNLDTSVKESLHDDKHKKMDTNDVANVLESVKNIAEPPLAETTSLTTCV